MLATPFHSYTPRRRWVGVATAFCVLSVAGLQVAYAADPTAKNPNGSGLPVAETVWGVLVAIVVLSIALMFFSRYFRTADGDVQPHAFGLPPGTIRALIAISLVITFVVLTFLFASGQIAVSQNALGEKVFIALSTALATVLGFYFGSGGAKQAMQEMSKALGQSAAVAGDQSALASVESVAKDAKAAAQRAANAHSKVAMRLEAAKKANDPKAGMLEVDAAETKKAANKAAAAANSAASRSTAIAKLSRDLAEAKAADARTALQRQIAEMMQNLTTDAADANTQADKAEKSAARHAVT